MQPDHRWKGCKPKRRFPFDLYASHRFFVCIHIYMMVPPLRKSKKRRNYYAKPTQNKSQQIHFSFQRPVHDNIYR